jgi:amidase
MDATDLAFAGAGRQAELVRSGEVSSRRLVELYLERIQRLDPTLNAYRITFPERALAEADQADGRAGAGDTRPLLGVPIAIKDDTDIAGELTPFGTNAVDRPAQADAEVVRRVRSAGAVILGKTNVPELAAWPFTESPTFGITRNPWDLQRTSGGSSGGAATAVAAGLAAAAICTDGAGSIRIPAACCHLVGLKPQRDRVPPAPRADANQGMTVWGALARSVADTVLVYDAIKDGAPWTAALDAPPQRRRVALSVAAPPFAGVKADAEQLGAVHAVADALRELGHEVVERELEYPRAAAVNVVGRYLRGLYDTRELLDHPERLSPTAKGVARLGAAVAGPLLARARATEEGDARQVNSVFGDGFDVALTPMFSRRPPRVGEYWNRGAAWTLNGSIRLVPWCGAFNHTGQPACAVPAGFAGDGFPLSAQLVAPPDGEEVLLRLAGQLEARGDWPAHRPAIAA